MIDLKQRPFYLEDEQIDQIKDIMEHMTLSEKIGQVFCPIGNPASDEELNQFIQKYKPGAMMFRAQPAHKIKHMHETLQKASKIPLMLAANLESGGNGICLDGTYFSRQMGVSATDDKNQAYHLGMIAGKEANAVGCNWSFAPIVDINYNYLNPITNIRTFGANIQTIIDFASEQIKALRENRVIPCIKHFPGDGIDDRDQHLLSSVNDLNKKQWLDSYGNIYKKLIEQDVETIMVGHILLPKYIKEIAPDIQDQDILPASLSKEVLKDILRKELGYNGLVVTDATAMIGYNVAMPRRQAIPLTIENGCDMILFNKNIDEDYQYLKDGLDNGLLSYQRLDEAVQRILATKMKAHLFDKIQNSYSLDVVGCKEHQQLAYECASKAITLVKNNESILPITPEKYKRIRLYHLKDSEAGGFKEEGSQQNIKDLLEAEGFDVELYDYTQPDFYEIFEAGDEYMKEKCDLVIYLAEFDTASNYTVRRIEWIKLMAADAPWFMQDIPTIFISLANPYHLLDVPMIKTYINCYSNNDYSLKAVINKLVGKEDFTGKSPIDPFCGRWDTKR